MPGVFPAPRGPTAIGGRTPSTRAARYHQSHLIAELKELTGLSPSGWTETRS